MKAAEDRITTIENEMASIGHSDDDPYYVVLALCEIARQLARIADHYTPPGAIVPKRKKAKR